MPFDRESLRKKTEKRAELKDEIKEGKITNKQAKEKLSLFARSLDTYGFCRPDIIQVLDSDDID